MKRILGLASAVVLCAACRSPAPMNDPFLGRTTVEPPGTALPPPGQPYYGAPPGAATTPPMMAPPPVTAPAMPRTIGPSNFSPAPAGPGGLSSSFAPNVSPIAGTPPAPTLLPSGATQPAVTPVSTRPRPTYGPPGGLAYPSAASARPAGTAAFAQAAPPKPLDVDRLIGPAAPSSPATAATPGAVVPATHWESGDNSAASKTTPAAFTLPTEKNAIRIVEPASGAAVMSAGAQNGSSLPAVRASVPGSASPGTLNQAFAQSRSPELAQLPPATAPGSAALTSASLNSRSRTVSATGPTPTLATPPAAITASNSTSSSAPTDVSRSSYEYDPQYHWLKGKLEYSQTTHVWRLRYIPPDGATDSYGGSVVLPDAAPLNGLNPGDFVTVQGSVGRASADQSSFAPQYNLERIQKQ